MLDMAQILEGKLLKPFLIHEIKELERIKRALNLDEHIPAIDNIVLAIVPSRRSSSLELVSVFKDTLRESDIVFPAENFILLLLPGTDAMGAVHILEGLADFIGKDLKDFAFVVYPEEGQTAQELIENLQKKALNQFNLDLSKCLN